MTQPVCRFAVWYLPPWAAGTKAVPLEGQARMELALQPDPSLEDLGNALPLATSVLDRFDQSSRG